LNKVGSMLGWEMSPDQLGEARPGIRGPIDGLLLVGHWTRPGGGITPVIISAMDVARAVLRGATDRSPTVTVPVALLDGPGGPIVAHPFRELETADERPPVAVNALSTLREREGVVRP